MEAQDGDAAAVYDPELLPKAKIIRPIAAPRDGYISRIICDQVGICSLILGGGRETKESGIDLSVGLVLCRKVGDYVRAGEPLAMLHANEESRAQEAGRRYLEACTIAGEPCAGQPLIRGIVE